MAAIPTSNIIGAPISGFLLGMNWYGMAGWRWLFILEGAPAIIFGIVTIFYLTDWPHQAKWLPDDEREWITTELEKEKQAKKATHSQAIWKALKQREVILLALAAFCMLTSVYGFTFWFPTIVKQLSGLPNIVVALIAALPYCVGLIAMLLLGWSSDRTVERRWHTALPMIAAGVGLVLSATMQNNAALAVSLFCFAAAGLYGYLPCFWALPTILLTGAAAATAIGLINSVGNLGGFVGPYVVGYVNTATNSFFGGMLYLALSALVAAGFVLALRQGKHETVMAAGRSESGARSLG